MNLKAIIFDTRSIQRYIFSANKLRTNIGASYLVEKIFDTTLIEVLQQVLGSGQIDADTWQKVKSPDWTAMDTTARIGYIGGGNALVLFRQDTDDSVLQDVVYEFSKRLLVEYPGLRTGAAIGSISLEADGTIGEVDGLNDLSKLIHKLKEYQGSQFPEVSPAYTGLTLVCDINGETANAYDAAQGRFCSQEVMSKLRANTTDGRQEAMADAELRRKIQSGLEKISSQPDRLAEYAFPKEIEHLGQQETESYFAVVHIDGNNMGQKFSACKTLTQRKNKSLEIRQKTIDAFCSLVDSIMDEIDSYEGVLNSFRDSQKRRELPVRPLVLGGDDMTFVCPAKLALKYAKRVMLYMNEQGIDTCGGIAILPDSYPFFRGYVLAEQLCDAAKNKMRPLEKGCWLDFAILHGEQAPTLEQIRKREYSSFDGHNMHFGPYCLDDADNPHYLDYLEEGISLFRQLPMNKVKDMRSVLPASEHIRQQFLQQLGKDKLPDMGHWQAYRDTLWHEGETPYVDAIEMMDFYMPEGDVVRG